MSLWFNPTSLSAYTLAKASAVNSLMLSVQVAFDKLPDPAIIQQNRLGYCVDSGAANALVVGMPITLTAYTAGINLRVKVLNTNTGASTINVDGLGAVAVKRADGSALVGAELLAGSVVDLSYDGTVFRLPPVIVALTAGDIAAITAGLAANYEPIIVAGTSAQYYRGDKTFQTLDKAAAGLANVDNTSDANKPVSTAQQTALNLKLDISAIGSYAALLSGATFTGNVGIGVAPSVKLHISTGAIDEAVRIVGTSSPYLSYYQGGTLIGQIQANPTGLAIVSAGARLINFYTGGVERARIDSSGNMAIGATTAAAMLDVKQVAAGQPVIRTSSIFANPYAAASYMGSSAGALFLGNGGNGNAVGIQFSQGGQSEGFFGQVQTGGLGDFVWQGYNGTAYIEQMRLNAGGNLAVLGSISAGGFTVATQAYVASLSYITAAALSPYALLASPALTGNPTAPTQAAGDSSTKLATTAFVDRLRSFAPCTAGGAYTLTAADRGGKYAATGNVTVPTAIFADGDVVVVWNSTAGNISIVQGASTTLLLPGTASTGNRTLAQKGLAIITCHGSNTFTVAGPGVT